MWNTPAVDPKNGLIAFAVGNPNPDVYGENRKGDNAYTNSIVGVNAQDRQAGLVAPGSAA